MTRIRIKRVYEPEAPEDGYRVLVDKLWPRGIRKEALRYDLWAKEIAPTPGLRTWFHAAPEERWEEFRRRYTGELRSSPAVRDFVRRIAGKKRFNDFMTFFLHIFFKRLGDLKERFSLFFFKFFRRKSRGSESTNFRN